MTPNTTMETSVRRYLHERRQLGFALKARCCRAVMVSP